jgi:hypothetical protein
MPFYGKIFCAGIAEKKKEGAIIPNRFDPSFEMAAWVFKEVFARAFRKERVIITDKR